MKAAGGLFFAIIVRTQVRRADGLAAKRVPAGISGVANLQQNQGDTAVSLSTRGVAAAVEKFTGNVSVNSIAQPAERYGHSLATVTIEPGARSNWHKHPDGQILVVTKAWLMY